MIHGVQSTVSPGLQNQATILWVGHLLCRLCGPAGYGGATALVQGQWGMGHSPSLVVVQQLLGQMEYVACILADMRESTKKGASSSITNKLD